MWSRNGSVQLSGTRLEASGRVHVGWSINGKEYALGGLVNNITSDLVAKAILGKGILGRQFNLGVWKFMLW